MVAMKAARQTSQLARMPFMIVGPIAPLHLPVATLAAIAAVVPVSSPVYLVVRIRLGVSLGRGRGQAQRGCAMIAAPEQQIMRVSPRREGARALWHDPDDDASDTPRVLVEELGADERGVRDELVDRHRGVTRAEHRAFGHAATEAAPPGWISRAGSRLRLLSGEQGVKRDTSL